MKFNDTRNDIEYALANGCPFIFIWGGRGHGKTYPTLKYVVEEMKRFVFVKRTETDIALLLSGKGDEDINPFMQLNKDCGWNIHPFRFGKSFGGFWNCEKDENGTNKPVGEMLGYILPLSTVSKVKGFNIDADIIIYDEFIPQVGERITKGEGDALWNLVETCQRNAELLGKPAMPVVCLANATLLNNPVFMSAHLVNDVERMIKRSRSRQLLKDRGVYLRRLEDNDEFTKAKSNTALYKMMKGTRFARMALENEFSYEDFGLIRYTDLKGYVPRLTILYDGEKVGVWQHPNTGAVYITRAIERHAPVYNVIEKQDRSSCRIELSKYYDQYLRGNMTFENYEIKQIYLFVTK